MQTYKYNTHTQQLELILAFISFVLQILQCPICPIIVLGYDPGDHGVGDEVGDDDVGSLLLGLQPGGHLQYSTV